MRLHGILAIAFFLSATTLAAAPLTITVPQDYPTIAAALTAASSGDIINVNPGTYTQLLDFGGKAVALRSVGGPAVTKIQLTYPLNGASGIRVAGPAEISGFTITHVGGRYGVAVNVSGDGTLIRGNIFENHTGGTGQPGAAIVGNPASPVIDGNLFRNNTTDLVQESGGVVAFYNGSTSGRSSPVIQNNVFVDNDAAAVQIVMPSGNQPKIINNTFVNNSIAISYESFSTAIIRNNILANNSYGFRFTDGTASGGYPIWDHNLLFNSGDTYNWMEPNVTADPRFVGGWDFHLFSGSPAIGAGSVLGAPKFDFDGRSRSATSNDLGAYVFVPEPTTIALSVVVIFAVTRRRCRRPGR